MGELLGRVRVSVSEFLVSVSACERLVSVSVRELLEYGISHKKLPKYYQLIDKHLNLLHCYNFV